MSTYAIGDLQGCLAPFDALLDEIGFHPDRDRLLLAGDLVNRGPDSLGALRRVYQLRDNVRVVLGNHDLHLLAASHGHAGLKSKDTLQPILDAPTDELPAAAEPATAGGGARIPGGDDPRRAAAAVAAGDPARALEVETVPRRRTGRHSSPTCTATAPPARRPGRHRPLAGDHQLFHPHALRQRRRRAGPGQQGRACQPPAASCPGLNSQRRERDVRVLFGHWAALRAQQAPRWKPDTGCVWGGCLTALRLRTAAAVRLSLTPPGASSRVINAPPQFVYL